MTSLLAIKPLNYARVARLPGTPSERFDAPDKDARILKLIGKAVDAPPIQQTKPAVEQATLPASAPEQSRKRRSYHRRDMLSED